MNKISKLRYFDFEYHLLGCKLTVEDFQFCFLLNSQYNYFLSWEQNESVHRLINGKKGPFRIFSYLAKEDKTHIYIISNVCKTVEAEKLSSASIFESIDIETKDYLVTKMKQYETFVLTVGVNREQIAENISTFTKKTEGLSTICEVISPDDLKENSPFIPLIVELTQKFDYL